MPSHMKEVPAVYQLCSYGVGKESNFANNK